jgi:NADH:ubiquinone oxidoreductase subunit H
MEPDTSANTPASAARQIFYNDHGLRAGWRLLIYLGMIAVLVSGAILIAKSLGGGPKGPQLPDYLQAIFQAIGELILFLVLLSLAWIMSRIERRKVGTYGLPLQ